MITHNAFRWLAAGGVLLLAAGGLPAQGGRAWVRLYAADPPALLTSLVRAGYDLGCEPRVGPDGGVDAFLTPGELESLERRGVRTQRLSGFGTDLPPDPRYKTDVEVVQILSRYATTYKTIARLVNLNQSLGLPKTAQGRYLYALKISDNPGQDEDEEAVLIYANEHSRELLAIEVVLYVADQLLKQYATNPTVKRWVDGKEIWIVPNANPDGLAYVWSTDRWWRKNRRRITSTIYGVDLNRNYALGWSSSCSGSTYPGSQVYKGPSPFSEVETQVLRDLHRREHFAKVCSNHNYGREVLFPYRCSFLLPLLNNYLRGLDQTLAGRMSYRTRSPSAEGEGYQWAFAENGAFSMLIESGTAFQPSWSAVAPEQQRVWAGIQWLLDLKVPLSGHVRDRWTGAPIQADIAVQGLTYANGEKRRSEPRYGRYHYFLPNGTYTLTFTADGYRPQTIPGVKVSQNGTVLEVRMDPAATITVMGQPRIGQTVTLGLQDPGVANRIYGMHASLGTSPPVAVGGRLIPLRADFLFLLTPLLPNVFRHFYGWLDGQGRATAQVVIPAASGLVGLTVYQAFVSLTPQKGIHHVSAPAGFTITN